MEFDREQKLRDFFAQFKAAQDDVAVNLSSPSPPTLSTQKHSSSTMHVRPIVINIAYPEFKSKLVSVIDGQPCAALLIKDLLSHDELCLLEKDFQDGGPEYLKLKHEPNRFNPHTPCKRMTKAYADDTNVVYEYSVSRHENMEPMPTSLFTLRKNIMECVQANTGVLPTNYSGGKRTRDDTPLSLTNTTSTSNDQYALRSFALKQPNYCLVNYYPDGHAGMGPHSDSPSHMEPLAPIYSFSMGAQRTFVIYNLKDNEPIMKIKMPTNSLLIMSGAFQSHYKHAVPNAVQRDGDETGTRINFTFRFLIPPVVKFQRV